MRERAPSEWERDRHIGTQAADAAHMRIFQYKGKPGGCKKKTLKLPDPKGGGERERTNKTRHVQKDIKVLDKTVTAAEHMKGAYIRTRDSAEQTQGREQGTPVGYAEDQVMEKGERAARGTVQQAGKQGEKVIHAVRERGRAKNEAEAFREKNGESSASSFSSGTEKTYQP